MRQYTLEARRHAEQRDVGWFLLHGTIGGLVAGIVFAMAEMVQAAFTGGNAFGPLRMIGAMALGEEALQPSYSLLTAATAGVAVHMALSAIYGVGIGIVLMIIPGLASTAWGIILTASVIGFLLWPINFYGFGPALGWTWFADRTNPLIQAVLHTLFGLVVGLYYAAVGSPRTAHRQ